MLLQEEARFANHTCFIPDERMGKGNSRAPRAKAMMVVNMLLMTACDGWGQARESLHHCVCSRK